MDWVTYTFLWSVNEKQRKHVERTITNIESVLVSTIKLQVPRKCLFKCWVNFRFPRLVNQSNVSKKSCQPISFFVWKKCIKNSFLLLSLSMAPCRSQSLVWLRKNCAIYIHKYSVQKLCYILAYVLCTRDILCTCIRVGFFQDFLES